MWKVCAAFWYAMLASGCHQLLPATGHHDDEAAPSADSDRSLACAVTTPAHWQSLLDEAAGDERWVQTCEDSQCDDDFYAHVKSEIQGAFDDCSGFLQEHPALAKCTENFRKFVPVWMRQHDEVSYGFNVDNHTYLGRETAADKPQGMMNVPDVLVEALPDVAKVEAAARHNGWKYLTHTSALSGARTFIMIPDERGRFDKWMILNVDVTSDPNDPSKQTLAPQYTTASPLSMLVVEKQTLDGQPLPRVHLNFRDWTIRPKAAGAGFALSLDEARNGKCFSCHPSGVRQLIPRHTPILQAKPVRGESGYTDDDAASPPEDFGFKRLQEFNARLGSYARVDWGDLIDASTLGPMLGKADGCTACHNGTMRGVLSVFTSMGQLHQKLATELSMPPNASLMTLMERQHTQMPALSADEQATLDKAAADHKQLSDNLIDSRSAALKAWLLEIACQ